MDYMVGSTIGVIITAVVIGHIVSTSLEIIFISLLFAFPVILIMYPILKYYSNKRNFIANSPKTKGDLKTRKY